MRVEDTLALRKFPVVVTTKCRNIDRIYPLKQQEVSQIYEMALHYPLIRRIIVFGSSVTAKCNIASDLDLCIDTHQDNGMKIFEIQSEIGRICDWNCDIIMYANMGRKLRETVEKEGVVIYE